MEQERLELDFVKDERRRLAVFDIDGTVFRSGLYRELIFEMVSSGELPDKMRGEFTEALEKWQKRASEEAFDEFIDASVVAYEKYILDVPCIVVDEAAKRVVEKMGERVYTYTRGLMKSLREQGYFLIAISGSQIELVARFASRFGFDYYVGQVMERGSNGFYTGKIEKTHRDKGRILQDVVERNNLTMKGSVAVGDTGGDVELLELVERPIAFNPDRKLFERAKKEGWKVVVERKNVIYELVQEKGQYAIVE
ncbi:HAD family phosphatase [Candidatus Saccharibacteria bacterium]|nr:HAD family phosphatase [Candidatus Saccharibacteria bacterium]